MGSTGIKVSELCLGTWRYGEATSERDAIAIVHEALDSGINFVDTSNFYQYGVSESIVGKALADGRRDRTVLATKVNFATSDDVNDQGNSRRHIMQQVELSLQRLKTDWIDLYYLHRPDPETPHEEELRAMDDLIRSGKVRYAGTSHYPPWRICRSQWIASERNLNRFVVEQPGYSLIRRGIEPELFRCAPELEVGLVPHSPLFQGVLTGKYHAEGGPPNDARGVQRDPQLVEKAKLATPVIEVLREIARKYDRSLDQVAIRWVLRKPAVCSTVIGPRTVEQLRQNLGAIGWELSEEDMTRLDEVGFSV